MFEPLDRRIWDNRESPANQDKITRHYLRLVEINAAKVKGGMPSFIDIEELKSMGVFGLLDAINKYDPDRGFKFETFASQRIYGSIIDGLRSQDWVPRGVRNKQKIITQAKIALEEHFMRSPSAKEIAEYLDMDEEDVSHVLFSVQQGNVLKLDTSPNDGDEDTVSYIDTLQQNEYDDGSLIDFSEMRTEIVQSIRNLPEKQRIVITLYYYQGLSLVEISRIFNITQSRVSQLYSKGMRKIWSQLVL